MQVHTLLATKGTRVLTIRPDQSLKQAAQMLCEYNVGALVVVNESGAPLGILSERDIVRVLTQRDDALSQTVRSAMTRELIAGSPSDDLRSVMQTMADQHFRHLPILDEGKLVGIISIRDVVEALLRQYQGTIDTLEAQITGEG